MSGVELARNVLHYVSAEDELPKASFSEEKSPEYWAGWALAEYQWYTGRRFKDIFEKVRPSAVVNMYPLFHEMDIMRFVEEMERLCSEVCEETRLKKIRESRGISQNDLASRADVSLRSIQMYEQRGNDIDKAQGKTLYRLSRVLGCTVEDLLENPTM